MRERRATHLVDVALLARRRVVRLLSRLLDLLLPSLWTWRQLSTTENRYCKVALGHLAEYRRVQDRTRPRPQRDTRERSTLSATALRTNDVRDGADDVARQVARLHG